MNAGRVGGSGWPAVWAVFRKDWRSEWRTRAALNAALLFSVAAPVALSFNVRQNLPPEVMGGLLWTVLLFAALVGLARAFVKEEESGTGWLLRLHCPAQAVLWGKALFNWCLLVLTQVVAVPLFVLFLDARIDNPGLLLIVLLLGDVGLAVASTVLGAIASQARASSALFAAIAVPILLPLLITAAIGTGLAFGAKGEWAPTEQTVLSYDAALLAAAWMLVDFVWDA